MVDLSEQIDAITLLSTQIGELSSKAQITTEKGIIESRKFICT
ncbi:hypothetical protein NYE67_03630 [Solibacillus sp. FSL W8-0474]